MWTQSEIKQLIDFTIWYSEGHLCPYDLRKIKSRNVFRWLTDDMHKGLEQHKDKRWYSTTHRTLDSIRFDPPYHLSEDIIWQIFNDYIFTGTSKTNDGRKVQGWSITKNKRWDIFGIWDSDSKFFTAQDEKTMLFVLWIVSQMGKITFQSAGSVWRIEEL